MFSKATTPPKLITLILLTAFSTLALNMFLPSLANIAIDLQTDYATVSLAVSGYLAITAIIQMIVGPLSDRFGRRIVALATLLIFTAASFLCVVATDIWTFLLFRMLQGGIISGYVLSLAIIRDTRSERESAGLIGYVGMAMAIAPMLGPMIGGALDTAFGWRSNFYFYGFSGIALLVLCWLDLGETRSPSDVDSDKTKSSVFLLIRESKFWAYSLCATFSIGAFYIFLTGAPLIAKTTFGVSTAELGVYIGSITAGFMTGGFIAGRLGPRLAPAILMIIGRCIACSGLAVGIAAIMLGHVSPYSFFGSTIFVGLGNGITVPGSSAGSISVIPRLSGSAAGFSGALIVAGGAILTSITGVLLPEQGAAVPLLLLMLAVSLAGLLTAFWAHRLEQLDNG